MDTTNGAVPVPASEPQAGAVTPASASGDLSQFVADPSAGASNEPQAQGASQVSQADEQIRHLQSLKDKAEAEKLAYQYQLQQLQKTQIPQAPNQPQSNPYDYQTDFPNWQRWEFQRGLTTVASEVEQRLENKYTGLIRQAQEMSWVQQHPGVDVNAVKMYNQMNGIAEWNLDAGYKLMTLPNQLNATAVQAAQQTMNNFRNPTQGAQPVRGQTGGGLPQTQFSYQKMAEAYNANPNIEESWPEGLRDAFWKETAARQAMGV